MRITIHTAKHSRRKALKKKVLNQYPTLHNTAGNFLVWFWRQKL